MDRKQQTKKFLKTLDTALIKELNGFRAEPTYVPICRGTSILGEVRNVAISRPTQQLLWYKFHDFLAIFALAHSIINQIA